MTHESDLDGNCENCGLAIGFSKTHTDEDCVRELKLALAAAEARLAVPVHLVVINRRRLKERWAAVQAFELEEAAEKELAKHDELKGDPDIEVVLLEVEVVRPEVTIRNKPRGGPDR
jgi:hypothetical protein